MRIKPQQVLNMQMNLMPGHGWHGCRCWVTQRSAQRLIVVRTYSRGNPGRAVFQGAFLVVASQAAFLRDAV